MAFYKLPTHGKRSYRGKYPHRIREYSAGYNADKDGNRYVYFATNDGARYTVSRDLIDIDAMDAAKSPIGNYILQFVTEKTSTDMTQAEYDIWLASIREASASTLSAMLRDDPVHRDMQKR